MSANGGNLGLELHNFRRTGAGAEERSILYASIDRIDISAQGIEAVFCEINGKLVSLLLGQAVNYPKKRCCFKVGQAAMLILCNCELFYFVCTFDPQGRPSQISANEAYIASGFASLKNILPPS